MRLLIPVFLFCFEICAHAQTSSGGKLLWKYQSAAGIIGGACAGGHNQLFFGDTTGNLYSLSVSGKTQKLLAKLPAGILSTPAVAGNRLFVYCNNGILYSLDLKTGATVWQFNTGGEKQYDFWDYYRSSPLYADGLLYFGSGDQHIYAVEAATGKEKWKFKTGGIVHADPVLSNDTLYIGSYDGKMYALSAGSGQLIWEFKTVGDRYFPKGEIQKAALIAGDAVIAGSRDFNIYAISKSSGTCLWNRKEAGSWIIATPILHNGNIFYGTSDSHSFYSTSQEDGSTNWKVPIPFRSYNTPVVFDSRLFAGCFNGILYELDPASGKVLWQFSTVGKRKNGQTIFDASDQLRKDFKMYGNEEETARAERMIFNVGAILATPLLRDGVLYFGATDGYFYALDLR